MSDYAGEYSGSHGGCSGWKFLEEETVIDYDTYGTKNASKESPANLARPLYTGVPWIKRDRPISESMARRIALGEVKYEDEI